MRRIKNTNRLSSRLEVVEKWLFENDLGHAFSARSDLHGRIEPQFYQFWDDQITKIAPDLGTNFPYQKDMRPIFNLQSIKPH